MIKYLIIDDEYMAHEIIKGYCDLLPQMQLMKKCYDALEAMEYLNENEIDLIFLDLNMPKLKGFEFLRTLTSPPKVIVTTAYKEFAIEGFELNVVDYLLKPFSFERFLKAINKAIGTAPKTTTNTLKDKTSGRIFLRSNKQHIQVVIDDILYIEAAGNYCKLVFAEKVITVREKISDILDLLAVSDFMQVHKSFAVAKKQIERIEGNRIFIDDHTIPIGAIYKRNIAQLLKTKHD